MTEKNLIPLYFIVFLINTNVFFIDIVKSKDTACGSQSWMCGNGECIRTYQQCDGTDDCGDATDENSCTTCKEGAWMCRNGRCLLFEHKCDGTDDCGDKSDETNCTTCKDGSWKCNNGRCLKTDNKCDGVDDCGDVSDERDCKFMSSMSIIAIIVGVVLILIFIAAVVTFIVYQRKKILKIKSQQRSQNKNDNTIKYEVDHYDYPMTDVVGVEQIAHSVTFAQHSHYASLKDEDDAHSYGEVRQESYYIVPVEPV